MGSSRRRRHSHTIQAEEKEEERLACFIASYNLIQNTDVH
jgi:hypothetical protein